MVLCVMLLYIGGNWEKCSLTLMPLVKDPLTLVISGERLLDIGGQWRIVPLGGPWLMEKATLLFIVSVDVLPLR